MKVLIVLTSHDQLGLVASLPTRRAPVVTVDEPQCRWNRFGERTPWFRACTGDGIAIDIEDVDAAFHDDIGGRTIELSELVRIAAAREVLSFGFVKELVLSAVEQRETLAAPARSR